MGRIENIKYLGSIKSITPMNYIVISMAREKPIPIGSKVYYKDEYGKFREVGLVVDIIGNVKKPYAVVKIKDKDLVQAIESSSDLYYEPWKPPRKARRR
ncbi:MAG: hypothetical protein QXJ33_03600 [Acidilobaceae archaeon]